MKTSFRFLTSLVSAVLALGLAGCGGSSVTNVNISGTITGLTESGLILSNGYNTLSVDMNATSFKFPTRLNEGLGYVVSVLQQPIQMTCTVANAGGTIGTSDVTNVRITCEPNKLLRAYLSGLTGSVTLVNGKDNVTATPSMAYVDFPTRVAQGASYGVTILPGSTTQNCTVTNGVGTVATTDVTNVQVTCQ